VPAAELLGGCGEGGLLHTCPLMHGSSAWKQQGKPIRTNFFEKQKHRMVCVGKDPSDRVELLTWRCQAHH